MVSDFFKKPAEYTNQEAFNKFVVYTSESSFITDICH